MSETDSFIEEVTEEVRRDKLFAAFRKYGWIAVLAILLLVGGAAWREWQKSQATAAAQAFGDAILFALEKTEPDDRIAALEGIDATGAPAQAVLSLLIAAEQGAAEQNAAAVDTLLALANQPDVPEVYRDIARFKALSRAGATMSTAERRTELEAMAVPGLPLRMLAEEQLAFLSIEEGDTDAAIKRLNDIIADAETTAGLRRRAAQLIVALGGVAEDA